MKLVSDWLKDLRLWTWHFAHIGFGVDLFSMAAVELVALYGFISRLADASK